jgi:Mn-dependent DtxR family transcriptional regulator
LSFDEKVLRMIQDGLNTPTDIAEELGCVKSAISKAAKRLHDQNLIEIRGGSNGHNRYYPKGFMKGAETKSALFRFRVP